MEVGQGLVCNKNDKAYVNNCDISHNGMNYIPLGVSASLIGVMHVHV